MNSHKELSFDELCDLLCDAKRAHIIMHVNPDADTVGSATALKMIIEALGNKARCVCADEVPPALSFLFEGLPSDGEDFEGDGIFVIAIDVAAPKQMGALWKKYNKKIDLMIDHHVAGTTFAPNYVRAYAAATGEIIYDIAEELIRSGKISSLPEALWRNLYAAISSDTGAFRYHNTTARTHEIAARLFTYGVPAADINRRLFENKTPAQVRAHRLAFDKLQLCFDGKIGMIVITKKDKHEMTVTDADFSDIVNVARGVCGVLVGVTLRQSENEGGEWSVSLRANEDIDCAALCATFGGGGHKRAAGCTVKAENEDRAREIIIAEIEKEILKYEEERK